MALVVLSCRFKVPYHIADVVIWRSS